MGLITCEKCKKIYDYEKYNGICPKCARYNRETTPAREHQEYHNKYDGGYSHTTGQDHHSYHQRYDTNKNPHGSQLEGVQKTLREVLGAEHKVTRNTGNADYIDADRKKKTILGIVIFFIVINLVFPLFGLFVFPIAIGLVLRYLKKKKK